MVKEIKETVHYIGDIRYVSSVSNSYKSKRDVLYAHIKYIDRSAVFAIGNKDLILENAERYNKRVNSRVAGKTVFALPNNLNKEDYEKWCNYIRKVLSENFDVNEDYIYIVIHEEHNLQKKLGTKNLHAHVVFNPINKDGKPSRTQPKDLKNLHKAWQEVLVKEGYTIRKYEEQISKLGWRLRKDDELLHAYKEYLDSKTQQKLIEQQASQEKQSSNLRSILSLVQEVETVIVEVEVEVKEEQKATNKERAMPKPQPEPKPSPTHSHSQFKETQEQELNMKISVADERDKKTYPTQFLLKEARTLKELKEIVKTRFYSNIVFDFGYRSSKNAIGISNFLVFDVDGTDRIERVEKILREKNIKALITTTKSHTENSHHFRVLIKTDRELQENELQYYKHFMKIVADELNIDVDKAAFDLARMYAPKQAEFIFIDGKELKVDGYLEKAKQITLKEIAEKEYKSYKSSQSTQNWIYVDVNRLLDIDIESLIDNFENISKKWKEGSQVYVRTQEGNKYGINKKYNVAYNFKNSEGYGVISYLQEQLQTTHLLNIAKYLQDNHIASDLIVVNDEVFAEKLNRCIDNSYDFDDFIENVRDEFNVKSVFVDFNSGTIKIGQFKVKLDDNELDEIYRLYSPKGPKGPGL